MKIGIDGRFFGEAGPGRYTKAIIEHLEKIDHKNQYVVFLRKRGMEGFNPANPNFRRVFADYKWYSWEEQTLFLAVVLKERLDLLYVPHFNIPVLYPGKIIAAIPDIIMHTFSTEAGTTLPKLYFIFKKWVYKLVVKWAVVRSRKIIVSSNDTLSDFLREYPSIPRSKYVLAYEGVDPSFLREPQNPSEVLEKYGVKKPYLLYISSMYEHKNVKRLVDAFEILIQKYSFAGQLVLAGKKDKYSEEMRNYISQRGLSNGVLILRNEPYISDNDIVCLRVEASAYVFPSLKEGFSLTPVEAQALGLVCTVSDIPCHREVYGDSVLYFDPMSVEDMAEKIHMLLIDENLRQDLRTKGLSLYKKYNWMETARITLDVFEGTEKCP